MSVRLLFASLAISVLLFNGCGDDSLGPVARPLVGSYALESRTFIAQDSAGTQLAVLTPPQFRAVLTLTGTGRYAYTETLTTALGDTVFAETGQWSVLSNQLFLQSDTGGSASGLYAFDGTRLVRTVPDLPASNVPGGLYKVVDVWLKEGFVLGTL
ncbi:MAG: hypothetical protein HY710_09680 [Candidatus Latescibacteria bacterium]|nr:hypothetical protein [Candidatus Latescibacterota bacterium]